MDAFQSLVPASVFVEWRAQPGFKVRDMQGLLECGSMCCDLYHVHLQECFFNEAGPRHICQFSAPDAESVRTALRAVKVKADRIWAGRIFNRRMHSDGNVVIERTLNRHERKNTVAMLDSLDKEWEERYGFLLVRAMVALDNKRAVFICNATDREAIDRAVAQMSLEGPTVWPYRLLKAEAHGTW